MSGAYTVVSTGSGSAPLLLMMSKTGPGLSTYSRRIPKVHTPKHPHEERVGVFFGVPSGTTENRVSLRDTTAAQQGQELGAVEDSSCRWEVPA